MQPAELTTEEQDVVGAIASLESAGQAPSLEAVARRAELPAELTRSVLSRLLGELGLVQERRGDELGPYYVLSGRAGAATGEGTAGPLSGVDIADQLQRYVGDRPFPTTTDRVIEDAVDRGAPQPLLAAVKRLPEGRRFLNLQDLADAVNEELSD